MPDISKALSRYLLNEQIRKPCCLYLQKIITNLQAGTMFSLPNRSDKSAVEKPQISKHLVSTSGSHFHFSGAPGALRQSFSLLSGHRFKSFLSTREESRAPGGQSLACHQRIPVSPAAVHQAVSKYNEGAYAGLELSPCTSSTHPLLSVLVWALQGGGLSSRQPGQPHKWSSRLFCTRSCSG